MFIVCLLSTISFVVGIANVCLATKLHFKYLVYKPNNPGNRDCLIPYGILYLFPRTFVCSVDVSVEIFIYIYLFSSLLL